MLVVVLVVRCVPMVVMDVVNVPVVRDADMTAGRAVTVVVNVVGGVLAVGAALVVVLIVLDVDMSVVDVIDV